MKDLYFSEQHHHYGLDTWVDVKGHDTIVGGVDADDYPDADPALVREAEKDVAKAIRDANAEVKRGSTLLRVYNDLGSALFADHWEWYPY